MPTEFKSESINLSIFSSSVITLPLNNMILFLQNKGGGPRYDLSIFLLNILSINFWVQFHLFCREKQVENPSFQSCLMKKLVITVGADFIFFGGNNCQNILEHSSMQLFKLPLFFQNFWRESQTHNMYDLNFTLS